ncbi:hypothetical protein BU23DRAFT_569838 [Bimuria novae-zelandiae CBS 107.79]|uniref:Uncharacterized protein n=1 Tax=Bimuria novae-zelandiae CBS 107.79 TaxID=1447943 RepID=A0A6A5V4W9_9PLEO|nr:hypothetical protein BU23DRAFT_569838 [Bimuria novae-zelandiae CBS 107.79]
MPLTRPVETMGSIFSSVHELFMENVTKIFGQTGDGSIQIANNTDKDKKLKDVHLEMEQVGNESFAYANNSGDVTDVKGLLEIHAQILTARRTAVVLTVGSKLAWLEQYTTAQLSADRLEAWVRPFTVSPSLPSYMTPRRGPKPSLAVHSYPSIDSNIVGTTKNYGYKSRHDLRHGRFILSTFLRTLISKNPVHGVPMEPISGLASVTQLAVYTRSAWKIFTRLYVELKGGPASWKEHITNLNHLRHVIERIAKVSEQEQLTSAEQITVLVRELTFITEKALSIVDKAKTKILGLRFSAIGTTEVLAETFESLRAKQGILQLIMSDASLELASINNRASRAQRPQNSIKMRKDTPSTETATEGHATICLTAANSITARHRNHHQASRQRHHHDLKQRLHTHTRTNPRASKALHELRR